MPQGTILEVLLFLFYINDLPSVSNSLSTVLFADDTTFFCFLDHVKVLNSEQIFPCGPALMHFH